MGRMCHRARIPRGEWPEWALSVLHMCLRPQSAALPTDMGTRPPCFEGYARLFSSERRVFRVLSLTALHRPFLVSVPARLRGHHPGGAKLTATRRFVAPTGGL
jgi:hypothetical protein